jgi:hypothetical protein
VISFFSGRVLLAGIGDFASLFACIFMGRDIGAVKQCRVVLSGIRRKDWGRIMRVRRARCRWNTEGTHFSDSPCWSRPRSEGERSFASIRNVRSWLAGPSGDFACAHVPAPAPARGNSHGGFRTHERTPVVRIITVPEIPGALGWWSRAPGWRAGRYN